MTPLACQRRSDHFGAGARRPEPASRAILPSLRCRRLDGTGQTKLKPTREIFNCSTNLVWGRRWYNSILIEIQSLFVFSAGIYVLFSVPIRVYFGRILYSIRVYSVSISCLFRVYFAER